MLHINVRQVVNELNDEEDANVPGIYLVSFKSDVNSLSLGQQAGMALDIFHAHQGIEFLDDFEIDVIDAGGHQIEVEDGYSQGSHPDAGSVEKVSDDPVVLGYQDQGLTAEQLDCKYNPDGEGEHPVHTRANWRGAVANENTISGYWAWVEYMINDH